MLKSGACRVSLPVMALRRNLTDAQLDVVPRRSARRSSSRWKARRPDQRSGSSSRVGTARGPGLEQRTRRPVRLGCKRLVRRSHFLDFHVDRAIVVRPMLTVTLNAPSSVTERAPVASRGFRHLPALPVVWA